MPRYIDAKQLEKQVKEAFETQNPFLMGQMLRWIRNQPTIDAVEVVRCKDCKHWKYIDHLGCTDFAKLCKWGGYMVGANGYCIYGERKEGDYNG